MKATRILILFMVSFCLPLAGLAQSNAPRDYNHAHKNAEKYQKSVAKERRKQEKAQAKAQAKTQKAYLKQHQHN